MLTVIGVSVHYGNTVAVDHVGVAVGAGQIVAVLGPSGSGKTSLLRAIAGLEPVTSGTIQWDNTDLADVAPHRRVFGLMFQDHALFDHRDVLNNVTFGLRARGVDRPARAARAKAMLELVGLAGYERRPVHDLSGGEQQRVALARALAPSPRLLMLDEPLASVDRERRNELATELHRIIRACGIATLLVTHDLDEAFTLADSVVILDEGRVEQAGDARAVWRAPTTIRAARFLGVASELIQRVERQSVLTPWGAVGAPAGDHEHAWIGFRPSDLVLDLDTRPSAVTGIVVATWFRGDHFVSEIDTSHGRLTAVSRVAPSIGAVVGVGADLGAAVVIGA